MEKAGRANVASRRFHAGRLAPGRRPGGDRKTSARRRCARDQGGVRRAQRDVDRRDEPHRTDSRGDRPRRASRAAAGRHDLIARLDRLSPRRMGCRRHRRRLAERPDAAAGTLVQRDQRQGARGVETREAAALVLGVERDDRDERDWLFPLHARDQPALRTARSARDAAREEGLPNVFARHISHGEATRRAVRGWGLEILCVNPARIQLGTDRGDHARRTRAPTRSARSCSSASTCRSARASAS